MVNGILNIYKEKGYTSHDVVACLRRIVGQKKIGHTGTLDPDAEGVLPVCLGQATRVCDMLTENDKSYEAVLLLGVTTDTQDITGTVLRTRSTDHLTDERVIECIRDYIGSYDQIPPMYSAVKVNGKKLYELARQGKTVERAGRRVTLHDIRILDMDLPRVRMAVDCSKGTYIRTLCHDIGESLGAGGCMESLLRTRAGQFSLAESIRLAQVAEAAAKGQLGQYLIPTDKVFSGMRALVLSGRQIQLARNGNPFSMDQMAASPGKGGTDPETAPGEQFRVYDAEGRFIAVYHYDSGKEQFRITKMFFDPSETDFKKEG